MKNILFNKDVIIALGRSFNMAPNEEILKCSCGKTLGVILPFGKRPEDNFYVVKEPHIKIVFGIYCQCVHCTNTLSKEETYAFCPVCYPKIHPKIMEVIGQINPERTPQPDLGFFTTIKQFHSKNDISQQIKLVHQGTKKEFERILSCVQENSVK